MAETPSTMLQLGTLAADFSLPNHNPHYHASTVTLDDFSQYQALLIMFICNHCPYVKLLADSFSEFAHQYQPKGLGIIAINSNDVVHYPADRPAKMAEEAQERNYPFPYLFDESQQVASAYRAACTPDFFLYDANRLLVYRGQYDSARPSKNEPVTGSDIRRAVDALLSGQAIFEPQIPSVGCNIKWKEGIVPYA